MSGEYLSTHQKPSRVEEIEFPDYGKWLEIQMLYLQEEVAKLIEQWNQFYQEIENLKQRHAARQLKLGEFDLIASKEREYWKLGSQIDELKMHLTQIEEEWLEFIENGTVNPERKDRYDQEQEAARPHLSKQKAAIQREIARTGVDPRNSIDPLLPIGNGYSHLTTGRAAKDLNAGRGVSPDQAGSEFAYRTADTHGGKRRKSKQ